MITAGAGTVTISRLLTYLPPGPATVVLTNTGGTANVSGGGNTEAAYLGFGGTIPPNSFAGGVVLPAGGVMSLQTYPGGGITPLYAISAGTTVVSWVISTPQTPGP